jgi:flavodoxin
LCFAGLALAVNAQPSHKVLVAYFSWSGNTKAVAEQIAHETGGTLFEIKTVRQYPNTYDAITKQVKAEQEAGTARPTLAGKVANMAQYDTVFLGWPTWWGQMPMGVATFLESYDFAGKTICPFNLSGMSGFGKALALLKKEAPKALIKDGLEIKSFSQKKVQTVKTPNKKVTTWVKKLGYGK